MQRVFVFFPLISIFSPRGFGADTRPHGWNRNMCALSMQEMVSAVQQVQASSHLNELGEAFRKVPGHDKWKTKDKKVNSKVLTRKSRNSQNVVSPMLLNVQLLCQINERCHVYSQVVLQPPHCVPKASVVLYHYWVISWALLPLCLRFPPYISDNSFVVFFFFSVQSLL